MKRKILNVLGVLFGLMFLNAGLNKFFNYMPPPDDLPAGLVKISTAMAEVGWLMPLVAVIEIVGGLLFMIPRFRALGALLIIPILVGIMLIHFTVAPQGVGIALALFAIWLWTVIEDREKYLPLVK